VHPHFILFYFILFRKSHFDWPTTNIFGTWRQSPQHSSPIMLPSPKIEACFVTLCHASRGTRKIDGSSTMAKLVYGTKK
jgi:hypothetical protein